MNYPNQVQGVPIPITFLTKYRTLYNEKINSKITFNNLLENFKKNPQFKTQAKPKDRYTINGKEIRKSQTLEEIILQNMSDPNFVELSIELNDLFYSGDVNYSIYKKIIQPKQNPFGLYIYSTNGGFLNCHNFPEKTINLFELNKINEGSAYCNSNEDLYISGGKDNDNKNFWIINNNDFNIKKKNMPFSKQNHSMIYLNFNENEEWVFIIGGNTKKSFYYDLNKNYFINWGDTNDLHTNPAIIKVGEYLYIFDSLNINKNYFEKTKLLYPSRKWEKIIPKIDKNLIKNFPINFGVSFDSNGNILFLGGNNNMNMNNTYVYDPLKNEITLSQNGTNDNMIFSDKSFYKINNRYNIAFPKSLFETKEICIVDKNEQSIIKINIDIPNGNRSVKIKSKINLDDKNYLINKNNEGTLTIKDLKPKKIQLNTQINNNYVHQMTQPQFICEKCQICHQPLKKDNFIDNKKEIRNPTRQNPYIEKIYDKYYPTYEKKYERKYGNFKENNKVKVEIIYDKYTPIKVDYELAKPYSVNYKKIEKKEEQINNKEEEKQLNNNININVNNNINTNIIKENIQEEKQQIIQEQKEYIEKIIEPNQEKMEPYINEEENIEQENKENVEEEEQCEENNEENQEEHNNEENQIEDNNEENNELQNEEKQGNNYYKHYGQKNMEQNYPHEVLRDSLEFNENNNINNESQYELNLMNKEIKDENSDSDLIKPIFKLDFGFKEDDNVKDEINFDIMQGLKLNFENDKKEENKENIIIKEEDHQSIHGEEEEINYENHENEENEMEVNYEQEEEYNVEEDEEEMKYEEEEVENEEEQQNSVIEIGQEGDNEDPNGEHNNINFESSEEEN